MIVEMTDDLVKAVGICAANSECLRDLVRFHKIPVYLESTLKEIRDGSILISTVNGDQEIACDSVILSVGYTPDQSLYRPAADGKKDGNSRIHVLGDAQAVGNLKKAIWGAYDLGVSL
jgi:2-enoate reductase